MGEEESDMKRNEFEALALLRRWVKEMRANGEMDAQHNAGAATQPRNRPKRSHETSSPPSVNFETRELNAATLKI